MTHLTQRTDSSWSVGPSTTSDSYTNNRHNSVGQLWQYDADGNLLMMPGTAYTYDAGGRIDTAWSGGSATLGLDGDGKKVKSVEVVWDPVQETDVTTYSFYVHSSILGRMLTEKFTNDDPNSPSAYYSSRTFVYGDSGVIAWQESNSSLLEWVWWEHRDASNASYRTSAIANQPGEQQELDPTGANQGISDASYQSIPDEGILAPHPASNNPSQPNTTYSIDGIRVSLDDFIQNLQIFYKGNLGLNEELAKQSADDRNYQCRWVRRDGYADYYHYSTAEIGDSRIVTTIDTTRVYFGQWQTTAVSLNPSLAWLLGLKSQKGQNRQNSGFDIPGITNQVNAILSKQACIDFANRMLNAVSTKGNPVLRGGNLQELFKDFLGQKNGGYTRTKPPGSAGYGSPTGLIRKGDGKIFSRAYPSMSGAEQTAYDAGTTVAELFHVAGRNEYYTDRVLAEAVHNIPEYAALSRFFSPTVFDPRYADKPGAAKNPNHGGWSSYFHDIQRQLCGP